MAPPSRVHWWKGKNMSRIQQACTVALAVSAAYFVAVSVFMIAGVQHAQQFGVVGPLAALAGIAAITALDARRRAKLVDQPGAEH